MPESEWKESAQYDISNEYVHSRLPRTADVAKFNVTFIYYGTYSATGVAIQLVQNFFNWFSTTVFWCQSEVPCHFVDRHFVYGHLVYR